MKTASIFPEKELLSLYPVLGELAFEEITALRTAAISNVAEGAVVFTEKQACRGFPLLLSGSIKVVKNTSTGREIVLYRVEPGGSCVISSSCLLGRTAYTAQGIAEMPLKLLVLPTVLFARLLNENSHFRDFVFHLLADRIAELMQLVEEVAFHRLDQRLAKLLLAKTEPIRTTHQSLAEELGSVREIVSRLLRGFSEQGLVTLGREQIKVIDRGGLLQLAESHL